MKPNKVKELLRFSIYWMLGTLTIWFGLEMVINITNFTILMMKIETMSNQMLFGSLVVIFVCSLIIYLALRFSNYYFDLATKKEEQD